MIFWRPYPLLKPREEGAYQCTIVDWDSPKKKYVMDLYYSVREKKWYDKRRQNVFNGYKVYKSCREPIDANRVFTDSLCERTDIVAWKKMPRPWAFCRKKVRDVNGV